MVTEALECGQLDQGCYLTLYQLGVEPATSQSLVLCAKVRLPSHVVIMAISVRLIGK